MLYCRRPVDAAPAHGPEIDDVTEQEHMFGRIRFQKIQQVVGLAGFCAQMNVGEKDGTDLAHRHTGAGVREPKQQGFRSVGVGLSKSRSMP